MIGIIHHHRAVATGNSAGNAHGKLCRFRPSASEQANVKLGRQCLSQRLRQFDDRFTEIARVRCQSLRLFRNRFGNARIGVAHRLHIVVKIDVSAALVIEQIGPFPANDMHRVMIEQEAACEMFRAALDQLEILGLCGIVTVKLDVRELFFDVLRSRALCACHE